MATCKVLQCVGATLAPPPAPNTLLLTFTFRTSLAWNSGVQLWWMKPIPPVS